MSIYEKVTYFDSQIINTFNIIIDLLVKQPLGENNKKITDYKKI
jgi:hypothetical protein